MADELQPILVDNLYRHAYLKQFEDGEVAFTLPERIPFVERDDTKVFIPTGQEYLWDVALAHYGDTSSFDIELGEVIAQFQPEPIQDLSIKLIADKELYIPSMNYIFEVVRGPSLILEAGI